MKSDDRVVRSRNIGLSFRVTEEERKMIKERMKTAGIKNMRAFIVNQVLTGRIIHIELDSVNEMVRLLSNATNNINQIAKRTNETGNIYAVEIEELRKHYDELWTQAKEILRRLSAFGK